MSYKLDVPLELRLGLSYQATSSHRFRARRGNPHKSWWVIRIDEEIACFLQADVLSTLRAGNGWAVHLGDGTQPTTLGYRWRGDKLAPLVIAKFVNKNASIGPWHGYPADYQAKPDDCPPVGVLQRWVDEGFLERKHATRIRRGVKCF